jgi:hypothetical protein
MEIVRELCSFEGRLAGTDAERRAANRMAERLRAAGRRAEAEPIYVHPQLGLIYAAHCLLGVAGSLVAVAVPVLGFGLVLFAATSMYLDLNARFHLLRRLFFRRASQNVVSRGARPTAPARLLLVAHVDAARTGAVYAEQRMRRLGRLGTALPFPFSPSRLLFWSLAFLVPVLAARAAGLDSGLISVLQLPPTLVLLVAMFAFVDIELSDVVPGANDNASGVATVISLASELEADPPSNLDVWVVLTGAEECLMEGMRAFMRARRKALDPRSTYVVNVDSVGRGDVRFELGEGPAVTYELGSRLTELCEAIAAADAAERNRFRAAPLRHAFATDALPARLAGCAATTITCLEPGAQVPANYHLPSDLPDAVDPEAVDRAHEFALELIRVLDRDVGRSRDPVTQAASAT